MSDADVESYKQIKSDLDVLRQSVEKSELWVYKSNKPLTTTATAGTTATTTSTTTITNITNAKQLSTDQQQQDSSAPTSTGTQATPVKTDTSSTVAPTQEDVNKPTADGRESTTEPEEEDDEDEYKKIQKVSFLNKNSCAFVILFDTMYICNQYKICLKYLVKINL